MTDPHDLAAVAPPTQPGWYADVQGAWWWWDGGVWTPAGLAASAASPSRSPERTTALIMWVVFLVGGGWIAALIFYLVSKDKPFVRHHSAEALNLSVVVLLPQLLGLALMASAYLSFLGDIIASDPGDAVRFDATGSFWLGLVLVLLTSVVTSALSMAALFQASKGRWWRLPLPFHPVRGVVRKGEEPYSVSD